MFWRRRRSEELEDVARFVDEMKRGRTVATGDSLLETLRQIHDRRETAAVNHDHKQLLKERLRRQMAARAGRPVVDTVPVPELVAPAPRRRALQYALAASIAVHIGIGVAVLPNVGLDPLVITWGAEPEVAKAYEPTILIFTPPLPKPQGRSSKEAPKTERTPSAGVRGDGMGENGVGLTPQAGLVPAVASRAIAPPVAPSAVPVVASYPASLDGLADRSLATASATLPTESPIDATPQKARPMSEVIGYRYERAEDGGSVDVKPKILYSPKPIYPDKALRYQVAGKVRLSVILGSDGSVRNLQVVSSLGYGLDDAAKDAASRIKFVPAQRGGKAVSFRTIVEISFELR
jgi:protein TonB